jgi:trans-aconitate 2-methyltransferase
VADTWSPSVYLRFEDERTRPARDLLAHVPLTTARRVVDVGCGPANSTALLAARFPGADVVGIDSSPAMLEEARRVLPSARFVESDANTWLPDTGVDLVFANAIYQWVPAHLELFPRILSSLAPGGVLAVQMPDNVGEPTHRLMQTAAADVRWAARLKEAARPPLPPPSVYYDALGPTAARIDIWHTVYNHVLADADAIVEWVRGTGLRPFIDPLATDERGQFLTRYRELVAKAYPPAAGGRVLLRFPRLFIVAVR